MATVFATLILIGMTAYGAKPTRARTSPDTWRVLLIFSEGKDLPGNVLLEQSLKAAFEKGASRTVEFYTEHLDASRFSDETHYQIFRDYLGAKYAGQDPDLLIIVMARDFKLAETLPAEVFRNVPTVFVSTSELPPPESLKRPAMRGIIQQLDVRGTVALAKRLQPDLRQLVIIGGNGDSDRGTLARVEASEGNSSGVRFEYWTNEPFNVVLEKARRLPPRTAVLVSTIFEDADGKTVYMTHAARMLAPIASVPVYALSPGAIDNGAVGGAVVDIPGLGERAARMGLEMLGPQGQKKSGLEVSTASIILVDWQALQRWELDRSRLPAGTVITNRSPSLWAEHKVLISGAAAVIIGQTLSITALLTQRLRRRRAEAEIIRQRDELAHVTRVSTMGQLASSLAHEINQPLGAILRNAEAAELFLQHDPPDVAELKAILADIRKDDQRAGGVIDRMRSLLKKHSLRHETVDIEDLLEETAVLALPDAKARQVRLTVETRPGLGAVHADRIHLQQVLLNLILNAMDALKDAVNGERNVMLFAGIGSQGQTEVRVIDSGTGIPAETLSRIFDPFFTTKTEGLGMGLAISRTIIESHGGSIRAENNATCGATFIISLPAHSLAVA